MGKNSKKKRNTLSSSGGATLPPPNSIPPDPNPQQMITRSQLHSNPPLKPLQPPKERNHFGILATDSVDVPDPLQDQSTSSVSSKFHSHLDPTPSSSMNFAQAVKRTATSSVVRSDNHPTTSKPSSQSSIASATGSGIRSVDSLGIDKETNLRIAQMDGTVPPTASFERLMNTSMSDRPSTASSGLSKNTTTQQVAQLKDHVQHLTDLICQMAEATGISPPTVSNLTQHDQNYEEIQDRSHRKPVRDDDGSPTIDDASVIPAKQESPLESTSENSAVHSKTHSDSRVTDRTSTHDSHHSRSQENLKFENKNSSHSTESQLFNNNEFSLACSEEVKLYNYEGSVQRLILHDDTPQALSIFYNSLVRSIGYAFKSQLLFLPPYEKLTKDIDFRSLFLRGLFGHTLSTCENMYYRMGDILKSRLLSPSCISATKSPLANRCIRLHQLEDGWMILQELLKDRSTLCGARMDIDLDNLRVSIELQQNESYFDFYTRNQRLLTEYKLYIRDESKIPVIKILARFVSELCRCPSYGPYLTRFNDLIEDHRVRHGHFEDSTLPVPFTLKEVYNTLYAYRVPLKPPVPLLPSSFAQQKVSFNTRLPSDYSTCLIQPPADPTINMIMPSDSNNHIANDYPSRTAVQNEQSPNIAASSIDIQSISLEDSNHPAICAFRGTPQKRCRACLGMGHHENDCRLRGQHFLPPPLQRQINQYNNTFGDKPPPGHVLKEWKPSTTLPDYSSIKATNNRHNQSKQKVSFKGFSKSTATSAVSSPSNDRVLLKRPFSNATAKHTTNSNSTPSINSLSMNDATTDVQDDDDYHYDLADAYNEDDQLIHPSLGSFISNQIDAVQELQESYGHQASSYENETPKICSFIINNTDEKSTSSFSSSMMSSYIPSIHSAIRQNEPKSILRLFSPPTSDPFGYRSNEAESISVSLNTPNDILEQVLLVHESNEYLPHGPYLRHFSKNIEDVENEAFDVYCKLNFHIDSGANAFAIRQKELFYFYINSQQPVETVEGNHSVSQGWGGLLVRICNRPTLIVPTYHCPHHPKNTFSLSALKRFSNFHRCSIDQGEMVTLVNSRGEQQAIPLKVHNDSDFAEFEILTTALINQPPSTNDSMQARTNTTLAATTGTQSPVSSSILANNNQKLPPRIPKQAMHLIAYFYVHLHAPMSPQQKAIDNMNQLLQMKTIQATLSSFVSPSIASFQSKSTNNIHHDDESTTTLFIPAINNLYRGQQRTMTPFQQYIKVHLAFQHVSKHAISQMMKNQMLEHLPHIPGLDDLACSCEMCLKSKTNFLPRGLTTNVSHLKPFEQLHMDFAFWNYSSIRGFTSTLDITCAATSYTFGFPTKSKAPPLQLVRWFITVLRKMGHNVLFIRVDEGGELARSSEFCSLIIDLNCVLQTTGGANSENNGKVEIGNKTKANMVRTMLATFKIIIGPDLPSDIDIRQFWCYAYQYASFVLRRTYNSTRKATPHSLVNNGKIPSFRDLVVFGSICTTVHTKKNFKTKLDQNRSLKTYFMGYSNHEHIHLVYDPLKPRQVSTSRHSIVEEILTFSKVEKLFSSPVQHPNGKSMMYYPAKSELQNELSLPHFAPISSPFSSDQINTFEFQLDPPPSLIGIEVADDHMFNMPYIKRVLQNSCSYHHLPPGFRTNKFILSINGEAPITGQFALDLLRHAQRKQLPLRIELAQRTSDNATSLQISRAMFDQLPNLMQNRPVIASLHITSNNSVNLSQNKCKDRLLHLVRSPVKPPVPKSFFEALKSPLRRHWIAAAFVQYSKNRDTNTFSSPFPKSHLPPDTKVFRTTIVCEIKPTEMPMVWELKVRECIVGTPQIKGIDFMESYWATCEPSTVRLQICISSALRYTMAILDVKNAFQTTKAPKDAQSIVTCPPLYTQWLRDTEGIIINNEGNEQLVRQMFNSVQGTKPASNLFGRNLKKTLLNYGCKRSITDHGFYIHRFRDGTYMYLSCSTDDILTSVPSVHHLNDFVAYMKQYFSLSVQKGPVLNFLQMRIIQSNEGNSIDQGEYIYAAVHDYFNDEKLEKIKTVSTPMRTDNEYERELYAAPPQTDKEFQHSCLEHRGTYRHHIGKLIYPAIMTRFDIAFPIQRLSEFNTRPNEPAWSGINRAMRYLASDTLRPIFYPAVALDGSSTIVASMTPERQEDLELAIKGLFFV